MQNSLGSKIATRHIDPQINSAEKKVVEAIVTRADYSNNCCDIVLLNLGGQEKKNVPVRMYDDGTTWFPEAANVNKDTVSEDTAKYSNSLVNVETSSKGTVIIGPSLERRRSGQGLGQDSTSDSFGAPPGGLID